MIGLDAAGWVTGVDVECIEMGADLLDWREILDH